MKTEIIVTNYDDHQHELSAIRHQVFVEEQKVPAEIEWDERDQHCVHVLIRLDGIPSATGRIDLDKGGKVGRVAVLTKARRYGLGRKVMEALEQQAQLAGLNKIWFHAQSSAIGFYQSLDYQIVSEEFEEAGIPHRGMEKLLQPLS